MDKISLYRTTYNFNQLYEVVMKSEAIAIIGGGFLGSELACALARKGKLETINF